MSNDGFFLIYISGILLLIILWVAGVVKILMSDNIRLVKLIYIILSCSFPPFSILYLLKNIIINDMKKAPKRLAKAGKVAGISAKASAGAAVKTVDYLLKK